MSNYYIFVYLLILATYYLCCKFIPRLVQFSNDYILILQMFYIEVPKCVVKFACVLK